VTLTYPDLVNGCTFSPNSSGPGTVGVATGQVVPGASNGTVLTDQRLLATNGKILSNADGNVTSTTGNQTGVCAAVARATDHSQRGDASESSAVSKGRRTVDRVRQPTHLPLLVGVADGTRSCAGTSSGMVPLRRTATTNITATVMAMTATNPAVQRAERSFASKACAVL
jgi:hypothetical protein